MEPALAGVGLLSSALLCLGACYALGRWVLPRTWSILQFLVGAWLWALWSAVLAGMGVLSPDVLKISVWVITSIFCIAVIIGVIRDPGRSMRYVADFCRWKERTPSMLLRFGLALLLGLVCVRCLRAMGPVINWDSLNMHLPMLLERLNLGTLDPMYWVATDRRVLEGGIHLKMMFMAFDGDGRVLTLCHVLMCIWGLLSLAVNVSEKSKFGVHYGLGLWLFFIASDLWVYVLMSGDEPWFLMASILWLGLYVSAQTCSKREVMAAMMVLGLSLSIKITAVFFLWPIFLLSVLRFKTQRKVMLLGVLGSLAVVMLIWSKTLGDYGMMYPFQRWSDLLADGESVPKVFSGHEVVLERQALGLADHRDNHGVGSAPWSMFLSNLMRSPTWPIGPYGLWLVLVLLSYAFCKSPRELVKKLCGCSTPIALLAATLAAVGIGMSVWSFSSQAISRYLLPVWLWWSVASGALIWEFCRERPIWRRNLIVSVLLLSSFGLLLELKVLAGRMSDSNYWSPQRYWRQHRQDAQMIDRYRTLRAELGEKSGRAIYYGGLSVLMVGERAHLAQVGNEVGWRSPDQLLKFLQREGIEWWLLGDSAQQLDQVYQKLTDVAVEKGWITLVDVQEDGKIYRCHLSDKKY